MTQLERPRQVVFNLLKRTWGIEHQETLALLATDYTAAQYDNERKHARSREVVNIEPEKYYPGMFKPFGQTAAMLVSAMHTARRGPTTNAGIVSFFTHKGLEAMRDALNRYGFDGVLFSNSMMDIAQDERLSNTDKAHLMVLLFCSAGCTGDVRGAVDETLQMNRSMGARFVTTQASNATEIDTADTVYDFALLRIDSGGQGGRYVLSTDPAGTEIGRQALAESAITDVDMAVSKRHARIWRDSAGSWWIQGLGSTYGTSLIDSETHETVIVEPPKAGRASQCDPVELHLGDILILADTTQFWVQAI